ncbi:MAG: sn-glycerol-3-phosphate ABC transporter ATP-binding protein UgpC [Phycisphaerae bacterium]|nr:sn-glycerol-3-phosphate ABC transporter ATP-binding protein UgpC [Phycisphaerae bacterium]NUQ47850.1 sn-glycerol-3-phosphate ABC transporter ATP-binding protein UgpC [Phycisphaerae bacterium]
MAEVVLRDVSKTYPGGVPAVRQVSIHVRDSEFVVLVGPSGCGKSTTLRMVAGLEEVSDGEIRIGDRVVNDVPPKDRDIAMVFQNYALYPYMTVYENMAFSLKLRRRELGMSRADIDRKVREVAATLNLTDLLKRKPAALSGGQRQRVAVGRAIVRSPKAFLFDEPLSNLDAKLRLEMRAELKKLHRRLGTTTIYVTHDQEEAMTLGDRVVVMKDGVVHQFGTPLEVYERPVNRFVAGFVGSPPMNFLNGYVRRDGDGWYFDEGSGRIPLSGRVADSAARYADRPMVLGVRPESLRVGDAAGGGRGVCERCDVEVVGRYCHCCGAEQTAAETTAGLKAHVAVVEPLGDVMDVFLSTSVHEGLVARISARTRMAEGQVVPLVIDMLGSHLFEPGATGANVSLAANEATSRVA